MFTKGYTALSLCVRRFLTYGRGCALLGGLLLVVTAAPLQARTLVRAVTFTPRSDGGGYVIRVRASERIPAYSMPQSVGEHELEWTLYNTRLDDAFQQEPPEGPVTRYTTTQRDRHLILHFHLDPDRSVRAEAYRDRSSNDLLLSLSYGGAPVAPIDAPPPVPLPTAPGAETAHAEASGADLARAARERWKLDTVVIDPGHGGRDPGAQAHGLQEKDVVLGVARKLGHYIEEKLGINVVYTRTGDRFVALKDRGHIANKAGAKLFISLHVNAAPVRAARGTETFFLGPHKTEAARKVMERENSVIRYEENPEEYAAYDEQALVRQTLAQSAYMRQSEELAALVEEQFDDRVHRRSRGVRQAGFYVLWSASMPAVLVELGFLTNPSEAQFLKSERGQTYMASAIFRAVRAYKADYEKGIAPVAGE